MSDRAEDLARQLLEKTQGGKLSWTFVPGTAPEPEWANCEKYRASIDDGFVFSISRKTRDDNDNKVLDFELVQPGRTIFAVEADNKPKPIGPMTRRLVELRNEMRPADPIDISGVARFRLFSDLFHAAKQSAVGSDQTIEKVQQLLERIG